VLRLFDEVAALKTERDILDKERDRLSTEVNDLNLEKQPLADRLEQAQAELGELASLRSENENLKQRLEDESHQRLRGEIRELEEKLAAKQKQSIDQRDKLWQEIKDLTEQRDKFQRWSEQMGREIKQLRDSQPDENEVRSHPAEAAELLQKLRGKLPKSKANLRDVEELLDLISD